MSPNGGELVTILATLTVCDSSNVPANTSFGVAEIKEDCVAEIVLCFADYGNQYRRSSKQPVPTSFPTWC